MKKFKLPDQLPETPAELSALADQARAEIRVFQAASKDDLTLEDVERLEYLNTSYVTITTAIDAAAVDEQEHTDRLAAALGAADTATAAPAADAAAEADTTEGDEPDEGGAAADVVAEAEQVAADAAEPAPVTAGVDRPLPGFAGATRGNDNLPGPVAGENPKPWTMLKSAPRFAEFGAEQIDTQTLAEAIESVQVGQRTGRQQTGTKIINGLTYGTQALATMSRPQGNLVTTPQELYAELDRIQREYPRQGQSLAKALIAAGGWVSPSEQLYDFCPTQPVRNVVSLPEVQVNRGGFRFAAEPDFSGLLTGFHFTEAELEAVDGGGEPTALKNPVEIPGVDTFVEYRLEVIGWFVKAGILQNQGWPELTKKFVDEFMVAHQYRVSALTITKMLGESSAAKVVPTSVVLGATGSILNGLHVRAKNIQIQTRIDTVEGVAPIWFRDVLRADLAMRDGLDALSVSDGQVDGWLAERGIYLQYEQAWQSLTSGQPGHYDTSWWPGSVDLMLYPAGTFFRSLDNVITFGLQYPMEQLQKNRYTHGFVEDSFQVGKRCYPSHLIRIPLCVNGAVGAREHIDCTTEYATTITKTITTTGAPNGGNFTLKFGPLGAASATIPFNGSAANADTALTGIDDGVTAAGDIVTAGGALPTAITVTYPARLGDLQVGTNSLTAASGTPTVVVS